MSSSIRVKLVFVYVYLRDSFALKPFRDYSLSSVCILPQPAFYSQSAVCILHLVCILPLVRSLQSAVRSLRFTLTGKSLLKKRFSVKDRGSNETLGRIEADF